MRPLDDIEKRWSILFNSSIGVDLRQAVQDNDGGFDPCEDGLRSVCWRSFLLHGPLSKGSWTKKLSESRAAYVSLRNHFLRYIDNPNDVHSSVDPLADDETSPWATLRSDEESREEIMRDVGRCNQDNFFFREPETQRKLLDILFIYAKLNPDTGYRQGMHELLAPILWVVSQDSLDTRVVPESVLSKEGTDMMVDCLDQKYVEHDSFSIFCAVMQTAKSFYTLGETRDSSAIIAQSERIHKELLASVDPDLALHLQTIGMLPQIYCLPWIRLLMGRVFDLPDLLKLWDALFAERLTLDIVDWTCVALLLRARWQLMEADYGTAISLLTRFTLPSSSDSPRSLVKDALFLSKNKNAEIGAQIVEKYSSRKPHVSQQSGESILGSTPPQNRSHRRVWSQHTSPGLSPARFGTPPRQLENIFQDVQRRTEGWSVGSMSKALRGAVGEVRRNVNNLQVSHSREHSVDASHDPLGVRSSTVDETKALESRLQTLEQRNQALARMLENALESLRSCKPASKEEGTNDEDVFNTSLAKIQFVSVYLSDSDIQLPPDESIDKLQRRESVPQTSPQVSGKEARPAEHQPREPNDQSLAAPSSSDELPVPPAADGEEKHPSTNQTPHASTATPNVPPKPAPTSTAEVKPAPESAPSPSRPSPVRPSLADSSFSFMLGDERKRSSFVRSVAHRNSEAHMKHHDFLFGGATDESGGVNAGTNPAMGPERERRGSRTGAGKASESGRKASLSSVGKKGKVRTGSGGAGNDEEGEDGFTMSSLNGGGRGA